MVLDRLELAQLRFAQLRPTDPARPPSSAELSVWLETEVCPVVEELLGRPDFRGHACWPLRRLGPGAGGPERALVDGIDAGLVACARQWAGLARQPPVRDALRNLGPYNEPLADRGPAGGAGGADPANGAAVPAGLPAIHYPPAGAPRATAGGA